MFIILSKLFIELICFLNLQSLLDSDPSKYINKRKYYSSEEELGYKW